MKKRKNEKQTKSPFSYYGGKQRIASKIIPHIPRHTVYVEPFCGGAAVFWIMPRPKITNSHHYRTVLNDTNGDIVNFYRVLQDRVGRKELFSRLKYTPYSREEHALAQSKESKTEVDRAWAFFVDVSISFSGKLGDSFSYRAKGRNSALVWKNKKENLRKIHGRLQNCTIENRDAFKILDAYDSPQTFFYLDPPYPGTNQGHYGGYTIDDYTELVDRSKTIKGSFILSNYRQGVEPDDWESVDIRANMSAANTKTAKAETDYKRTETIWIVDNGGGADQKYFADIYKRPEFVELWGELKPDS